MKGSPAGDTQVSAQGSESRRGAGTPERIESPDGSCALGRVLWVWGLTLEVPGDCWPFTSSLVLRLHWPWCPHLTTCGVTDCAAGPGLLCSSWQRRVVLWEVQTV